MPSTPVIVYDVFANDGAGGPVDYGTVIATVSAPTYTPAALAAPSDNVFAVRARDTANSVGELNTDAQVRIVIDAAGLDITARPNPPVGLAAQASTGGGLTVRWAYNQYGQTAAPTAFNVYLTAVSLGSPSYASPAATVTAVSRRQNYQASLTGLSDGVDYWVAVRAVNGSVAETNEVVITVTGSTVAPDDVDDLAATVGN